MSLRKVVAGLVAEGRLLVFDHPLAGTQLPKGTVENGEELSEALHREVEEESGLTGLRIAAALPAMRVEPDGGRPQDWHVFLMRSDRPLPEAWSHAAVGSPEEHGLVFRFRWVELEAAGGELHPLFRPAWLGLRELLGGG